jgi:hypothetical protein
VARFARPLTSVAHGAARACVNVPPGCGESSGGRRRPGRARRELGEARQSLVSERATFAGDVGNLADSDGRVISRFLKRDTTVSRCEQASTNTEYSVSFHIFFNTEAIRPRDMDNMEWPDVW